MTFPPKLLSSSSSSSSLIQKFSPFLDLFFFCMTSMVMVAFEKQNQHQRQQQYLQPTQPTTTIPIQSLKDQTSLDAKERVCTTTIDGSSNIPTKDGHLRSEMRLQNLWHRATYIVVIVHDNDNEDENKGNGDDDKNTFILVQQRSNLKDYCPGRYDPTPGGVVGFQESYLENAQRELLEEMNIDTKTTTNNNNDNDTENTTKNTIQQLFTFPYQDDTVKVWGAFFQVDYYGTIQDLKLQTTEVSKIVSMSLYQVQEEMTKTPDYWTPDGMHAMKLYFQYRHDKVLKRRLLKGYSTGDLDEYQLRPKPKVIFFDCDDCLYFDGWQLANQLTNKIEEWCTQKKQLPPGKAYQLYKQHGTALKGLLAEGIMEHCDEEIDAYLRDVHDIPIHDHLSIDQELRDMMLRIDPTIPKYIFTASVRDHAERCLKALGIDDLFVDIIDVKSCNLATKHSKEAFQAALKIAGMENDPESCLFLDDSIKNIQTARSMGIRSFLVGRVGRDCGQTISTEHAEQEMDRIHDLPKYIPEIFQTEEQTI